VERHRDEQLVGHRHLVQRAAVGQATTSADAACANKLSYWGGSAGGVVGWTQHRNLFPSKTIVSIGLETSPEGWTGANLIVNDADAQCDGSRILQDQYGATLNAPYSVARYTGAVAASTSPNRNARDGAMLWNILKAATGNCGTAALASPGTIGKKAAQTLGVVDDPLLQQAEWK